MPLHEESRIHGMMRVHVPPAYLPVTLEVDGLRHGQDQCRAPWQYDLATGRVWAACPHGVWEQRPGKREHNDAVV